MPLLIPSSLSEQSHSWLCLSIVSTMNFTFLPLNDIFLLRLVLHSAVKMCSQPFKYGELDWWRSGYELVCNITLFIVERVQNQSAFSRLLTRNAYSSATWLIILMTFWFVMSINTCMARAEFWAVKACFCWEREWDYRKQKRGWALELSAWVLWDALSLQTVLWRLSLVVCYCLLWAYLVFVQ